MASARTTLIVVLCAALALTACGSGSGSTTPAARATPTAAAAIATAAAGPTVGPTEIAAADELKDLHALTLTATDVPFGFRLRSDQPVRPGEVAAAQIGIPDLAGFIKGSDLQGAWATFYTREQPPSALSSIVYRFGAADSAKNFVATIAGLTSSSYPAAVSVERVQADKIGDVSQMMRYRLQGARTLEYTWVQKGLAGQIVLRYTGDIESPDDVALLVATARKQAARMQAAP
jgi:hypothetical protein